MTTISEADLQITLPAGATARKFDDQTTHGLSCCMKAVDFIVELDNLTYFIEFKDPDNPNAQLKDRTKFIKNFTSGELDNDLKLKYRDSWLYEYAEGRADKPIYYLVLLGASTLSDTDLLARTDQLKSKLPMNGPAGREWQRPFVKGCAVMNLASWNKRFTHMPASRISS